MKLQTLPDGWSLTANDDGSVSLAGRGFQSWRYQAVTTTDTDSGMLHAFLTDLARHDIQVAWCIKTEMMAQAMYGRANELGAMEWEELPPHERMHWLSKAATANGAVTLDLLTGEAANAYEFSGEDKVVPLDIALSVIGNTFGREQPAFDPEPLLHPDVMFGRENPNVAIIKAAAQALGKDHPLFGDLDHAAAELSVMWARELRRERMVPVAWQVRTPADRPSHWAACTEELYLATKKTGRYSGFDGGAPAEVRALGIISGPQLTREELVVLAQQAIAALDVVGGHIDTAIERCRADVADPVCNHPEPLTTDAACLLLGAAAGVLDKSGNRAAAKCVMMVSEELLAAATPPRAPGITADWVLGYLNTDAPEESREAVRNAFTEWTGLVGTAQVDLEAPTYTAAQMGASFRAGLKTERMQLDGYRTAFFDIGGMLGLTAQPVSPQAVWETQMRPALQALIDAGPARVQWSEDPLTKTYVQNVPDKCDRIVWRGNYYHLPFAATVGMGWKANRLGSGWVVTSPAGSECEVRDSDPSPFATVLRQFVQLLDLASQAVKS